jgi:hypothetical protein
VAGLDGLDRVARTLEGNARLVGVKSRGLAQMLRALAAQALLQVLASGAGQPAKDIGVTARS